MIEIIIAGIGGIIRSLLEIQEKSETGAVFTSTLFSILDFSAPN